MIYRRILSLLLCAALLCGMTAAQAGGTLSLETVTGVVRPGRALQLGFEVPQEGTVDLLLRDDSGSTIAEISRGYSVWAGRNTIWWNGTWQGAKVPAGTWTLVLVCGDETAAVPITVGEPAPFLTDIRADGEPVPGESLTVTLYASMAGQVTMNRLTPLPDGTAQRTVLQTAEVTMGTNTIVWDVPQDLDDPDAVNLTFTLTDADGVPSDETFLSLREDEDEGEADTDAENEEAPAETEEVIQLDDVADQRSFTPSYASPYGPMEGESGYWVTPMDIMDEETLWNELIKPITVVNNGKKNAEKTQIRIYSEPDENSTPSGVVTQVTQGVRVLKTEGEWTLIEAYSSSFHGTAVEAWNMLVQGWVRTKFLTTVTPTAKRGIIIDKLSQRLYIFEDGKLKETLLVSTGLSNQRQPYNETRSGEFLLTSAVGEFASDNLKCSMAIRFNNGDLLHEVPHTTNKDGSKNYKTTEFKLGSKGSHGCIRVQRKKTPQGISMKWLWDNRIKNTKLWIWQDWQGRQMAYPDDSTLLYYNPKGGDSYHTAETCYSAKNKTFTPFTYGELENEPYNELKRCDYCTAPMRRSQIDERNAAYLPGYDHDPILTKARAKYIAGMGLTDSYYLFTDAIPVE